MGTLPKRPAVKGRAKRNQQRHGLEQEGTEKLGGEKKTPSLSKSFKGTKGREEERASTS